MTVTPSGERRRSRLRSRLRTMVTLGAVGALAVTGFVTLSGSASAQTTLASAAASQGKYFGTAVSEQYLSESGYVQTLNRESNSVTHENSLKWEAVQPNQGQFNWGNADRLFNHARSQGMDVRGHTLVWHSQLAGWVNSGNARQAMADHIAAVAGRYAGQVSAWDVVNEAFEENGSRRNSPFQQAMGNGFIAEAFRLADAADPGAQLCYNDYNLERPGAKQDAAYNLVRDLKAQGVPIDCIGFQGHFNSGNPMPSNFHETLQRFANLGVDVQITELDIAGSGSSQAEQFGGVVQACLAVSRCNGITVWGITDKYSWRSQDTPLLYDGNYQPKQAYSAVISAFGDGDGGTVGGGDVGGGDIGGGDIGGVGGNGGNPGTGSCSVSYNETDRWGDRFNGRVVVSASNGSISNWTVTVTVHTPQKISATWNGSPTWDGSGNVMTMRPNGNGSLSAGQSTSFGFTVMANGNWQAPTIGNCIAS